MKLVRLYAILLLASSLLVAGTARLLVVSPFVTTWFLPIYKQGVTTQAPFIYLDQFAHQNVAIRMTQNGHADILGVKKLNGNGSVLGTYTFTAPSIASPAAITVDSKQNTFLLYNYLTLSYQNAIGAIGWNLAGNVVLNQTWVQNSDLTGLAIKAVPSQTIDDLYVAYLSQPINQNPYLVDTEISETGQQIFSFADTYEDAYKAMYAPDGRLMAYGAPRLAPGGRAVVLSAANGREQFIQQAYNDALHSYYADIAWGSDNTLDEAFITQLGTGSNVTATSVISTWHWNGSTWTRVSTTKPQSGYYWYPVPTTKSGMLYVVGSNDVYFYNPFVAGFNGTTQVFNFGVNGSPVAWSPDQAGGGLWVSGVQNDNVVVDYWSTTGYDTRVGSLQSSTTPHACSFSCFNNICNPYFPFTYFYGGDLYSGSLPYVECSGYNDGSFIDQTTCPAMIQSGSSFTVTVQSNEGAPTQGIPVTLTLYDNGVTATFPNNLTTQTVTIPSGQTSVSTTVTTKDTNGGDVKVVAVSENVVRTSDVKAAAAALKDATPPSPVAGGTTCYTPVTLTGEAGPGGLVITVSSDQPGIIATQTFTVSEGADASLLDVLTKNPSTNTDVKVTFKGGTGTVVKTITVNHS